MFLIRPVLFSQPVTVRINHPKIQNSGANVSRMTAYIGGPSSPAQLVAQLQIVKNTEMTPRSRPPAQRRLQSVAPSNAHFAIYNNARR